MFSAPFRQLLHRMLGRDAGTTAAHSLFEQGLAFSGDGRHAAAAAAFARVLVFSPGHAAAHNHLGLALRDQGHLDAAVASYQRAVSIAPAYAEAHNNLGAALQLQGDLSGAVASYRKAVELAPAFSQPYLNLGRLLEALGDLAGAAETYRRARNNGVDPETFGHLLNAAAGVNTPRAPGAYSRTVFDNFAEHFDQRLVTELGYRIPQAIARCVGEHCGNRQLRILDLGCGTGLCGVHLRHRSTRLTGVDLSPAMLAKASARGIYDELLERDIADYLHAAPAASFDAIVAADVFIYIGELDEIFKEVARVAAPGAVFAFTIERSPQEQNFVLLPSGRYAQSLAYIRHLAAHCRLIEAAAVLQDLRGDPGRAIPGYLYALIKP